MSRDTERNRRRICVAKDIAYRRDAIGRKGNGEFSRCALGLLGARAGPHPVVRDKERTDGNEAAEYSDSLG